MSTIPFKATVKFPVLVHHYMQVILIQILLRLQMWYKCTHYTISAANCVSCFVFLCLFHSPQGVSPGVKYTTQRSDPILEAYQLTPSQVIPEYAAMEPTDVLSSSASSEQGGLSSSSSFGSSHGNPFFLKGPLKKKKPSKSSVVDEPKVPPTESSDTSAVEQTFQKLEITGVKINIADKIKKFENTS